MGVMFCWVCLKSSSVLKLQYFLANRYVCMNICMYVLHICLYYICMYVFYFKRYSVLMLKLSSKWQRGTWKLLKKRKFLWLWLKKRSLPEREVQQSFHMSAWRMHWWSHMSTLPCLTLFISTLTMGYRGKGGLCLSLKCCGMSEVQGVLSLLCLSGSYSLWSEWSERFFKMKSIFKVPEEPKKVVPEEKFPKLKPRREAEPPAKGIMTL